MPMPDTTNAKSNEFPPIKPDWYEVLFKDYTEKVDRNGNDYMEVAFDFVEGNRKAWTNLSYSVDFLWQLKAFKEAIGAGDTDTDVDPYKGARLQILCKNRVYKEKNQIDVTDFKPYGETAETEKPRDSDEPLPF